MSSNESWYEVPTQASKHFRMDVRIRVVGELHYLLDIQYLALCRVCHQRLLRAWGPVPMTDIYNDPYVTDKFDEAFDKDRWHDADPDARSLWNRWLIHASIDHPEVLTELGLSVDPFTPIYDHTAAIVRAPL